MLDDEQRQELTARLESLDSLGSSSQEEAPESAEPTAEDAEEQVEDREEAEPVAAEAESTDVEDTTSSEGRQSGAQRRISELVRQRNEATESFRELQERFAALEGNVQQMQQPQYQEQPQQEHEQSQYYDEYGNPVEQSAQNPDLANLRAEFDQYREAQVVEQVKGQLEQEIQEALATHPGIDGPWLRSQLIDAVRLNGNANIEEMAEYYSAFVAEVQQNAVSQHQEASTRQPSVAPPRLDSRGAATSDASRQADKPFTRDDARQRAYQIIGGS